MSGGNADAEIRALQVVFDALEPLDAAARSRVLDYTLKRLGMHDVSSLVGAASPAASDIVSTDTPPQSIALTADIRSLRETKQPTSAVEMAAVVAYYLSEVAPVDERRDAVSTADLQKYFKQAQYRLPKRIDMALHNAVAAGYFDRTGRGEFRLNPVGYNLVTHGLPREAGQTKSRATARKRTKAPAKSTKK
jgi:hypothetical protein